MEPLLHPSDTQLRSLLAQTQTIAVVGHSNQPQRPSYQIAQFLRQVGYRVYPVNPTVAEVAGHRCYRSLAEVPETVDLVNVFRRADSLPEIVEAAIAVGAKALWTQLGIYHDVAVRQALAAGLFVVTDACIQVEYLRLGLPRRSPS
ncbi:CoA-binding protein [Almyronema epifaneia]|uniref:CoA-binding protein n=1 Tax=Almyronema epifaneia S1 TaxID=2991925 RepID=A0ABW6I968_9CYAN